MENTESRDVQTAKIPDRENDVNATFARPNDGLTIDSYFCPADVADPFETVEWDRRVATIKEEGGGVLFEQTDCEIPSAWSQLATNVVASKYFYGENGTEVISTTAAEISGVR